MTEDNSKLKLLKSEFVSLFLNQPEAAETASKFIFDNLVDELILEHVFEIHRNAKARKYEPENNEPLSIDSTTDTTAALQQVKKAVKCVCPNCNRGRILPSKFAPHLECCMGMKRNSSRIASQRIANTGKESSYVETMSDDDEDWEVSSEKPKSAKKLDLKKKKASKNGRRPKTLSGELQSLNVDTVDDLASILSLDSSSRTWDTETNSSMYLTDSPVNKKKEKSKNKCKVSTP